MAPTHDEVYAYITDINKDHPDRAWTWTSLAHTVRRHFASTTPAIDARIDALLGQGRLLRIRVDHSGLVFWTDSRMATGYLVPYLPYRHDPLTYGTITPERPKDRNNLWANGVREFLVTDVQYVALVERFTAEKQRQRDEARAARGRENARKQEMLAAFAPDAVELLNSLAVAMPTKSSVDVTLYTSPIGDRAEELTLHIMVSQADLVAFLEILRAGVVLKEFAENNGAGVSGA